MVNTEHSIEAASKISRFCLHKDENNEVHLKVDDNYSYQVQGQMLLSGLGWSDFVVYFVHSKELVIERIYFNGEFCTNMFERLFYFYNMYFKE